MNQLDMLDALETAGALDDDNAPVIDIEYEIPTLVNRLINRRFGSGGRDHFIDRVNKCLRDTDQKILTKNKLNKWLSRSQENAIPAHILPAICWALKDIRPLQILSNSIGFRNEDVREDVFREKGKADFKALKALEEKKALEKMMKGLINDD